MQGGREQTPEQFRHIHSNPPQSVLILSKYLKNASSYTFWDRSSREELG